MKGTVRRLTALGAAALLCLSGWGCAFGKIRIEPLTPDPPVTAPPETEPPAPVSGSPETDASGNGGPGPEAPADGAPGPEEEPSSPVRYAEADFRERRGTGWAIKALSFRPQVLCSLGDGLVFAAGSTADQSGADQSGTDQSWADMSAVKYAVVDLAEMTVAEGEASAAEPRAGLDFCDLACFSLNGDPYLILCNEQEVLRLDPERLTVTGRAFLSGVYQYRALSLPDGRAVLSSANQGRLVFIDPADPENGGLQVTETEISMPEGFSDFWISGATEDGMLTAVFNNEVNAFEGDWRQIYGLIDSRTGETSVFGITDGVGMQAVGNYLLESDYGSGKLALHKPGADLGEILLMLPRDSWLIRPEWGGGENRIFFEHSDETMTVVTVMDIDTLRTEGQFTVETEHPWDYFGFAGETGDWLVGKLYENEGSEPCLFCWNWEDVEEPAPAGYYPTLNRSDESEIRQAIRRIYEDTGVSVYVGNEAVRYLYGYAVQVVTDPGKQLEGVRSLEAFFDNCPPGFIRELTENSSSIDICLTGKIIPEPGNRDSISDAAAFVTPMDDCQVMVLDVLQGGLTQTVAHEFLHIAENAMWNIFNAWWEEHTDWYEEGEQNPTDVFWYWPALNPEGFEYSLVYTDENGVTLGSDDPCVWNGSGVEDIDSIYFVDGYSTTYPTEDRARIFENLATCAPEELPECFRSEALRKKAAYLCACLGRAFRSLGEAEDVFWERSLNPEWDYEYFEANYEIEAQG